MKISNPITRHPIVLNDYTQECECRTDASGTTRPRYPYAMLSAGASTEQLLPRGTYIPIEGRVRKGDWFITSHAIGFYQRVVLATYSPRRGLLWWVGCQQGITTRQFRAQIKDKGASDPTWAATTGEEYRHFIRYVLSHPALRARIAKHEARKARRAK